MTRSSLSKVCRVIARLAAPAAAVASPVGALADLPPAVASPSVIDPIEPRLTQGRLANGLRYAVLPRQGPEPGIGLFMRIDGGFIAEKRPGERGLVHLLEHIAFDRSMVHSPIDRLHKSRTGTWLSFPAPSAGTTSWDETTYFVSSRTTNLADIDDLLGMFRSVAGEKSLPTEIVDRQRKDVMREMSGRQHGNTIYAGYIAAVAPGSPNDLIDGQNSDDVPTASINTIRELRDRLYRPERTMIVIVGHVDPAAIQQAIERRFGDWEGVGPSTPPRPAATVDRRRIAPISYSASAQGPNVVILSATLSLPMPARRERAMQATLIDLVAARAAKARLAHDRPGDSPGKASVTLQNADGYRLIRWLDNVATGQWAGSVTALTATTCRLAAQGFSEQEWKEAKLGAIADLQHRASATTVANVDLAKDIGHSLAAGREPITPQRLLAYAGSWLPTVGLRSANDWWRGQWSEGTKHVRVETPELSAVGDPAAAIRAAISKAEKTGQCRAE